MKSDNLLVDRLIIWLVACLLRPVLRRIQYIYIYSVSEEGVECSCHESCCM